MTMIAGRRQRGPLFFLVVVAAGFVGLGLVVGGYGLVRAETGYLVIQEPAASMTATIAEGDNVVVRTDAGPPGLGDIVLMAQPDNGEWPAPGGLVFKRVIGVGGDRMACCDAHGRITVNGKPIDENYIYGKVPDQGLNVFTATVPPGTVFVAGDWRENSMDSRIMAEQGQDGSVPLADVRGVVVGLGAAKLSARPLPATTAFTDAGLSPPPVGVGRFALDMRLLTAGELAVLLGIASLGVLAVVALIRRPGP